MLKKVGTEGRSLYVGKKILPEILVTITAVPVQLLLPPPPPPPIVIIIVIIHAILQFMYI
jgi:hypothetical protein